jgi:hypothetical protein
VVTVPGFPDFLVLGILGKILTSPCYTIHITIICLNRQTDDKEKIKMAKRFRLRQITEAALMVSLWVTTAGCTEKDVFSEQAYNISQSILHDPNCSQQSKDAASRVLQELSGRISSPVPILSHACYWMNKDGTPDLALSMFDKESDIVGIIIRETDTENHLVIEEQYPLFYWEPVGHFVLLPFQERKEGNKKDSAAWDKYQADPNIATASGTPLFYILVNNNRPLITISIPQQDKVKVYIAVYDQKENRSEFMPLESKLYRRYRYW